MLGGAPTVRGSACIGSHVPTMTANPTSAAITRLIIATTIPTVHFWPPYYMITTQHTNKSEKSRTGQTDALAVSRKAVPV